MNAGMAVKFRSNDASADTKTVQISKLWRKTYSNFLVMDLPASLMYFADGNKIFLMDSFELPNNIKRLKSTPPSSCRIRLQRHYGQKTSWKD